MSGGLNDFLSLDAPALLTAVFAAASCALLGNFLVLRKLSLMGDAISHAVLPGIVAAFLISGSRASGAVFVGAAAAGIFTAVCIELVGRLGRIESGAAMGVIFSLFFAAGVLMMEQAAARSIDLDADCLLHGQLETIFWFAPATAAEWFSLETLSRVPVELWSSFAVFLLVAAFVALLYKELALAAFDPELATAQGFSATKLHYALMVLVATAVVASFKAVGSILVIAMLICPAATARLLTDRLVIQIRLSLAIAVAGACGGYLLGAFGPIWLGYENSVSTAGMMTVVSGLFLSGAVLFGPQYGILPRNLRRRRLAVQVAKEDLLGLLYREEEAAAAADQKQTAAVGSEFERLGASPAGRRALRELREDGMVSDADGYRLSDRGRAAATGVVRTHRLWETYLVDEMRLRPDHVHGRATQLEHFTTSEQAKILEEPEPAFDPHGKEIPPPPAAGEEEVK